MKAQNQEVFNMIISFLILGMIFIFNIDGCNNKSRMTNLEIRSISQKTSIDSLFYQFADTCTWVEMDRAAILKVFGEIKRSSDGSPISKLRLYGCINYKDWE